MSGSVDVASLSDSRAYGTFSGTGTCLGTTGLVALVVSDGTFDVPVLRGVAGVVVSGRASAWGVVDAWPRCENTDCSWDPPVAAAHQGGVNASLTRDAPRPTKWPPPTT